MNNLVSRTIQNDIAVITINNPPVNALSQDVADGLDAGDYSPLRAVIAYDNAAFSTVVDLTTAEMAPAIDIDAVRWNAPLVEIEP